MKWRIIFTCDDKSPESPPPLFVNLIDWLQEQGAERREECGLERVPLLFTRYYPDGSLGKMFSDERTGPADRRRCQHGSVLVYTDYFKQQATTHVMKAYPYNDRRSSRGRRKGDS